MSGIKKHPPKLRVADLFCGCGGLSLGVNKSEFAETVLAYDNWSDAVECYRHNVDKHVKRVDLSAPESVIRDIKKAKPDIIAGGTPCQDFSVAGLRAEGARANLTQCFARIVADARPKWFLLENVPKIRTSQAYRHARQLFVEQGYGLTEIVINAAYYGVPQTRKRFICIGCLGERDEFMRQDVIAAADDSQMTVRQFYKNNRWGLNYEHFFVHPRNYDRRGIFSVDGPAPTIRGQSRPISATYKTHPSDAVDKSKAVTLDVNQRARLQTFPPKFKLPACGKTKCIQMVGNAVPVELAANLFRYIGAYAQFKKSAMCGRARMGAICGVERGVYVRWLMNKKGYEFEQAKDMWSLLTRVWQGDWAEILKPDTQEKTARRLARDFLASSEMRKDQISRTKKAAALLYEIHRKLTKEHTRGKPAAARASAMLLESTVSDETMDYETLKVLA